MLLRCRETSVRQFLFCFPHHNAPANVQRRSQYDSSLRVHAPIKHGVAQTVPFIAAGTGGIPELIDETDRSRLLFEPTESALEAKICEVLESDEWAPGRPRFESTKVDDLWLSWFERVARGRSNRSMTPLANLSAASVTVAVTHYERPKLLDQNLQALSLQSDVDFELIIVDDGSKTELAVEFLETIKSRYAQMRPQIIRQENRRELFDAFGYFHEIYGVTHEDWELHLRWALAGCKLLSLPQPPLFWYRVAPGSMSRSTSRYSNLRVVASTIRENISPPLAPILDLLVGTYAL
jgi:hypothetical protein